MTTPPDTNGDRRDGGAGQTGLVTATRAALGELADRARPVNLADRALAGARRRRRHPAGPRPPPRRHHPAGGERAGHRRRAEPRPGPAAGEGQVRPPSRLVTAAGFDVAGWPSQGGTPVTSSVVHDRAHHRYVSPPYSQAVPAPTGTLVVVTDQDLPYQVRLLDTATGTTTPLDIEGYLPSDASWSPDGSRLLFRVSDKGSGDTDTLDELDVTTLSAGRTAHYDRSTPLPAVSWNGGGGVVLYPHPR